MRAFSRQLIILVLGALALPAHAQSSTVNAKALRAYMVPQLLISGQASPD
jgi:hypothetical protein